MKEFLDIVFWLALSFMAVDYTLGRATVKDPLRVVLAALFAVFFVLLTRGLL